MIKVGEKEYEWVLLHVRNSEQFMGMIEVASDLKQDDPLYKRCLAADIMRPKVTEIIEVRADGDVRADFDHIVELRNPHVVHSGMTQNGPRVGVLAMEFGDRVVFLRASEILHVQFLDENSPLVVQVRAAQSKIAMPSDAKTPGGLIVPGGK